jgi:hypothetical protein
LSQLLTRIGADDFPFKFPRVALDEVVAMDEPRDQANPQADREQQGSGLNRMAPGPVANPVAQRDRPSQHWFMVEESTKILAE